MKLAIYGRDSSPKIIELLGELLRLINDNTKVKYVTIYEPFAKKINIRNNFSLFSSYYDLAKSNIDVLIAIGGDGTILRAITIIKDLNILLFGLNAGRLGFLSNNLMKSQLSNMLNSIVNKLYNVEERTLLSLYTSLQKKIDINFALNEIAICKKETASMISIETYLNDNFLNTYWADGLIVATPTGSTGYSISCGGPVVMPYAKNFVISPIAPHNLNVRPLIISDEDIVKIKVKGYQRKFLVSLDSRILLIKKDIELIIKKNNFKIKIINIKGFLNTLRKRLYWGEDKRN